MLNSIETGLGKALASSRTLELLSSDEAFLKKSAAGAFADLILFCDENEIPLEEFPKWMQLASYISLGENIKLWAGDIGAPFERILDACTTKNSKLIELNTEQLKIKWKKLVSVPFAPLQLEVQFNLVASIPGDYKQALRDAGSLRAEPEQKCAPKEIISCEVPSTSVPF